MVKKIKEVKQEIAKIEFHDELEEIATHGLNGQRVCAEIYESLEELGVIEINKATYEKESNSAFVRVTALGKEYLESVKKQEPEIEQEPEETIYEIDFVEGQCIMTKSEENKEKKENKENLELDFGEEFKKPSIIEKDIPVPAKRRNRARISKYPFAQMDVNDSFFVPDAKKSLGTTVWAQNKNNPDKKFILRFVTENGKDGARIWRTK